MFEDMTRALVLLLGFGIAVLWVVGRFLSGLVEHWRLHRAWELRMEERIALVARGLHPTTLAPLTPPPPGDGPGA